MARARATPRAKARVKTRRRALMKPRAMARAQARPRAKAKVKSWRRAVMKARATARGQATPKARARAQRASLLVIMGKRRLAMKLAWIQERGKELLNGWEKALARRFGVHDRAEAKIA